MSPVASPGQLPPLSRAGIDRAAVHRLDPDWLAEAWSRARVLVLDRERRAGVSGDDQSLDLDLIGADDAPDGARYFLGEDDGVPYFCVDTTDGLPGRREDLRVAGALVGDVDAGLLTTAVALANWHARHTHCPRCGALTELSHAGWVTRCTNDGSEHYPRVDPAMIVLVHDGDGGHCLLGHNVGWPDGRYSTLAGFVEPGESAEQCVVREVAEETAVVVRDVQYVASQPWPMPGSLMLGFRARADVEGGASIHVDGVEMGDAQWFTREQMRDSDWPMRPYGVSIAAQLIADWLAEG